MTPCVRRGPNSNPQLEPPTQSIGRPGGRSPSNRACSHARAMSRAATDCRLGMPPWYLPNMQLHLKSLDGSYQVSPSEVSPWIRVACPVPVPSPRSRHTWVEGARQGVARQVNAPGRGGARGLRDG